MTPARLEGYDMWKPRDFDCAAIQDARLTSKILAQRERNGSGGLTETQPGHVDGFFVLGIRREALRCLDRLFCSDRQSLEAMRPQDDEDTDDTDCDGRSRHRSSASRVFQRLRVDVRIETNESEVITTVAETYVWAYGTHQLDSLWDAEHFLRGASMQRILDSQPTWTAEEQALATIMRMTFAQVGDFLAGAILAGNIADLEALLHNGFDANAGCRVYGHPLSAAVTVGNEDMVRLLLNHGLM